MTKFVIDRDQIVHTASCKSAAPGATKYMATPKDYIEMHAHLARPDYRDRHSAPATIKPCELCIPSDAE